MRYSSNITLHRLTSVATLRWGARRDFRVIKRPAWRAFPELIALPRPQEARPGAHRSRCDDCTLSAHARALSGAPPGRAGSGDGANFAQLPSVPLDSADAALRQRLLTRAVLRETADGAKGLFDENLRNLAAEQGQGEQNAIPSEQIDVVEVEKVEPETPLIKILKERMQISPMPVSEYMQLAMSHPEHGYYMSKGFTGIFGQRGDFTTAPEISQMFGEIIGVWVVWTWQHLGCPKKVQLIELGPGRGTMMADILRACARFQPFLDAVSVHLVETSEQLQEIQRKKLASWSNYALPAAQRVAAADGFASGAASRKKGERDGMMIQWHKTLSDVPAAKDTPCIILAQEFLDCMPVRQFVKTDKGWCEKLVDLAPPDSPYHFRFVLSPGPTPASKICIRRQLIPDLPDKPRDLQGVEVSPEAWWIAQEIGKRVFESDGAALLIDYGNDAHAADTLQCDLTAHVDFSSVKRAAIDWRAADVAAVLATQATAQAASIKASVSQLRRLKASLLELEGQMKALPSQAVPEAQAMQARLASLKEELVRMSGGEGASGGGDASTPADAPVSKASAPAAAAGNAASAGYGTREKTLAAHGPATQCEFLHSLGIRERAQALFESAKSDAQKEAILKQYERLTSPAEMGTLFKVLAITCDKIPAGRMAGFAIPGARDTLN